MIEPCKEIAIKLIERKECLEIKGIQDEQIVLLESMNNNYKSQLVVKDSIIVLTNGKATIYKKQVKKERFWKHIYMVALGVVTAIAIIK